MEHTPLRAVAEADRLEAVLAPGDAQRDRVRRIRHLPLDRDRPHALLHDADVLEDGGDPLATQPAMFAICQASGSAVAIMAIAISPRLNSHSAIPPVPTSRRR